MKRCWSEGELRAFVDREMEPDVLERVAAHLQECAGCRARHDDLARRAGRVSALLEALPEPAGAPLHWSSPRPMPNRTRRWVPVVAALAACLALFFVMTRRAGQVPELPRENKPVQALPAIANIDPATPAERPAAAPEGRPTGMARAARPQPDVKYFLALDNEPFEVGVVMRVALGPAEVPADVVFSPDGRARAVRLVSNVSSKGALR